MIDLRMAPISHRAGFHNSMFAPAAREIWNQQDPFGLGRARLGQTAQTWYQRAKDALASFDLTVQRIGSIANESARNQLLHDYHISNPDQGCGFDAAVTRNNIADAERYSPVAYEQGFPDHGPSRRHVSSLEDCSKTLARDTQAALAQFGVLPAPIVIQVPSLPGSAQAAAEAGTPVLTYVAVGAGALVLLAVLGVI